MSELRVMSFNIRGSFVRSDGINAWENRAALNVKTIRRCAPDLIGFQEVQTGNLETYQKELREFIFEKGPQYNNREPFCYPSIAWNPAKLKRLNGGHFWLSPTPETFSGAWDTACIRSALWIELESRPGGERFVHLNTHLDHVSEEARAKGAGVILEQLSSKIEDKIPLVITGDFNCAPGSDAYRRFLARDFQDAYLAAGGKDGASVFTFHAFEGEAHPARVRMDWILTRGGAARWRAQSVKIVRDAEPPLYPSDHYPVLAKLALEG